jgi:hypothetical protein
MRFRLKACGLHLSGSAGVLALVLGGLYAGWYRFPGLYLTAAFHIVLLVVAVDLALGPILTAIVAHPDKARRVLARDIAVIVTVQLAALVYGAFTLWYARPLYYAFSADRLELVRASDLRPDPRAHAAAEAAALAPHWYSLPRWIWAPLPSNPEEAMSIVHSAMLGGPDVVQMPGYFRPWELGLPELRRRLRAVDEWPYLSRAEQVGLGRRMSALGVPAGERNTLILWGGSRRVLVVFDPATLRIRLMLRPLGVRN